MSQNIYYSADEYYVDDNSADEHSSQASDQSSRHDTSHSNHKCRKCYPPEPPREKCNCFNEPKRKRCDKCGKSHRRCEPKDRHCKSDRKCKCKKKDSECDKREKVITDECGKCIVIKIRPCK